MAATGKHTIRRATEGDAQDILACLAAAFEPFRKQYTPGAFEDTVLTPDSIRQRLAEMTVFVELGETAGVIGTVACVAVSADEGHIRGMAVLPERQGDGVAARLLIAVEDALRRQGCTRVTSIPRLRYSVRSSSM